MKMQSKPFVAFASGAVLLLGALCQSAQAQSTVTNDVGTATLTAVNDVGFDALTVNYQVLFTSGGGGPSFYTYDYTVNDPAGSGTYVVNFNVAFNDIEVGTLGPAMDPTSVSGGNPYGQPNGGSGVSWYLETGAGGNSGTLSYESAYGPTTSTANATGFPNPPAGWSTQNGQTVPVPSVVPEPATTTLLALTLLLLAFRPNLFKKA